MYTTLDKIHQMNEDWCHTLDSQLFDSRQIATGETHTKHMAFLGRKNMQLSCFYMFHIRLGREILRNMQLTCFCLACFFWLDRFVLVGRRLLKMTCRILMSGSLKVIIHVVPQPTWQPWPACQ